MASKILNSERQPVPLAIFASDVARRKALSGVADLPQNTGARRTESKKALLQAVEAAGKSWSIKRERGHHTLSSTQQLLP